MQHPLNDKWVFWFGSAQPRSKDSYESKLHSVGTVQTAEQFWGVFNALPTPPQLAVGGDLALFRDTIQPMWEDPQNEGGGRVQFILKESDSELQEAAWRQMVGVCV